MRATIGVRKLTELANTGSVIWISLKKRMFAPKVPTSESTNKASMEVMAISWVCKVVMKSVLSRRASINGPTMENEMVLISSGGADLNFKLTVLALIAYSKVAIMIARPYCHGKPILPSALLKKIADVPSKPKPIPRKCFLLAGRRKNNTARMRVNIGVRELSKPLIALGISVCAKAYKTAGKALPHRPTTNKGIR